MVVIGFAVGGLAAVEGRTVFVLDLVCVEIFKITPAVFDRSIVLVFEGESSHKDPYFGTKRRHHS